MAGGGSKSEDLPSRIGLKLSRKELEMTDTLSERMFLNFHYFNTEAIL